MPQFGRLDVSDGDGPRLDFVLICESVADDGGTQSALRASKARVTGGVLRVGRQLPSASRWVPCGAEQELIGHFPLTVAEQRLCVTKHTAPLLRRLEASRLRRWWTIARPQPVHPARRDVPPLLKGGVSSSLRPSVYTSGSPAFSPGGAVQAAAGIGQGMRTVIWDR